LQIKAQFTTTQPSSTARAIQPSTTADQIEKREREGERERAKERAREGERDDNTKAAMHYTRNWD
jgi:hypothetical protein